MNKFYKLIAKIVCYLGLWSLAVISIIWAFGQITVYR